MSALSLDINVAVQEAMDASIRETFSMMIGEEMEHLNTRHAPISAPLMDCAKETIEEATVVVSLSGGLQGSISVCLDLGAALLWTQRLIDHDTDHLDQTVVDAIGELGNMVVGGAKGRLEDFMLTLGLPCVLLAGPSRLAFPSNCVPTEVTYKVAGHEIRVYVSLIASNL
ncbi:chemotaxis protein CheX [Neorhodopirellula pilleata]|uniref:Chemotaxis phosphatase CheX-like domain-containing protein n=1 Tax=Neorhodopirellula pilleata TaxID=2714738 RepID=A0A5C5ZWV8_9BACT|nr:chemotaxis protein CheX [Neorhodopirellula pilleata]TWT91600.1 hypothetical protein Pla100_49910 [Neorhodopirellula pilleata]